MNEKSQNSSDIISFTSNNIISLSEAVDHIIENEELSDLDDSDIDKIYEPSTGILESSSSDESAG